MSSHPPFSLSFYFPWVCIFFSCFGHRLALLGDGIHHIADQDVACLTLNLYNNNAGPFAVAGCPQTEPETQIHYRDDLATKINHAFYELAVCGTVVTRIIPMISLIFRMLIPYPSLAKVKVRYFPSI